MNRRQWLRQACEREERTRARLTSSVQELVSDLEDTWNLLCEADPVQPSGIDSAEDAKAVLGRIVEVGLEARRQVGHELLALPGTGAGAIMLHLVGQRLVDHPDEPLGELDLLMRKAHLLERKGQLETVLPHLGEDKREAVKRRLEGIETALDEIRRAEVSDG